MGVVRLLALGAAVVAQSAPGAHFDIHVTALAILARSAHLLRHDTAHGIGHVEVLELALLSIVFEPNHIALEGVDEPLGQGESDLEQCEAAQHSLEVLSVLREAVDVERLTDDQ